MGRFHTHHVFHGFPVISEYTMQTMPWMESRPNVVIYGGGDAAGFRRSIPAAAGRRTDRVVYVGRIMPHKGIDVLIQALPPGAELIVCGEILDAEYATHLRTLAKGQRVEFVPPATDAEVGELYASATASVLPSVVKDFRGVRHEHPELLGLVLLEAMWHSTPVVASKVGGIPEIVSEGKNGLLVDPGRPDLWRSALSQLLEDSTVARRMGEAGRCAVEKRFNWDAVTRQTFEFYRANRSGLRNRRMGSATR
jgi:glycosyltransferase involved in cell wall biosynthesis